MSLQGVPKSKYLEFFLENKPTFTEQFELVGDVVLVERIKFPETRTASGIVLAEFKGQVGAMGSDRPHFYRVLLPGEGFYNDETKEDVALNCQSGDIVLVSSLSVRSFGTFPLLTSYESDSLGVTRDSEILWRFKGQENFERLLGALDKAVAGKVQAT
jgi:co-chaperonin GroES (HSP10)